MTRRAAEILKAALAFPVQARADWPASYATASIRNRK